MMDGVLPFDGPAQVAWNLVSVALWLIVVVDAVRRWRSDRSVSAGQIVAIFATLSVDGTYVPIGPVLWLAWSLVSRRPAQERAAQLSGAEVD
jgi:hypothetical protein